ncbi:MAG: hypothetical protein ACE5KA_08030 [Nitrososphaerales archaeon]
MSSIEEQKARLEEEIELRALRLILRLFKAFEGKAKDEKFRSTIVSLITLVLSEVINRRR